MSRTWLPVPDDSPFPLENLPFGVFVTPDRDEPRVGVAIGEYVLDAGAAAGHYGLAYAPTLTASTLNPFMAAGAAVWHDFRQAVTGWLTDESHRGVVEPHLVPLEDVTLPMPFEIADYVDFYASEHHATRVGELLRPGQPPLTPNWKHLPIGYHGRAGSVRVSGTPVVRPSGQRKGPDDPAPIFGASTRLDFEAEVGFVVGVPSTLGSPVALEDFANHVFGVCLVNDWSARDLQAWEYVPLGPFLGKSFLTSVSPWIVPLAALGAARVPAPRRDVSVLPYLDDADCPWGLDLTLEVRLNGRLVSRPPFREMYWTAAQQLAHLTVNGAALRTGDLFASGTVSGPGEDERGSLIELSRGFLEDGDEVTITATAPGSDGTTIGFGGVTGTVFSASGR